MADFELSPAFTSVRKKLGNMVFYNLEGEIFARKLPKKKTKTSPGQDRITGTFSAVSGYWKYLDGIIQVSWNFHAKKKKRLRGYSAFIGANMSRSLNGRPLELSRPLGEKGLVSFCARTGCVPGEIICEFLKHFQDADRFVTFFIQKKVHVPDIDEIKRIDTPAGTASPYSINGCEPGCEYFIYAVVTDRTYAEAETVSASQISMCAAAG